MLVVCAVFGCIMEEYPFTGGIIPNFHIANLTCSPKVKPGRPVTAVRLGLCRAGADLTGRRVRPTRRPVKSAFSRWLLRSFV